MARSWKAEALRRRPTGLWRHCVHRSRSVASSLLASIPRAPLRAGLSKHGGGFQPVSSGSGCRPFSTAEAPAWSAGTCRSPLAAAAWWVRAGLWVGAQPPATPAPSLALTCLYWQGFGEVLSGPVWEWERAACAFYSTEVETCEALQTIWSRYREEFSSIK